VSDKDYYTILGIGRSASNEEIHIAVRGQRRRWTKLQGHPSLKRRLNRPANHAAVLLAASPVGVPIF
jgi:hypothetical protein